MAVRTIRTYAITVLMLLTTVLWSAASWRTEMQQRGQDVIAAKQVTVIGRLSDSQRKITANSARLEAMMRTECDDRRLATAEQNRVLDALITASSSWGPRVQSARLALWRAAKAVPVSCR